MPKDKRPKKNLRIVSSLIQILITALQHFARKSRGTVQRTNLAIRTELAWRPIAPEQYRRSTPKTSSGGRQDPRPCTASPRKACPSAGRRCAPPIAWPVQNAGRHLQRAREHIG